MTALGRRPGLAVRLIVGQLLVLAVGGGTFLLVAAVVAPGSFHDHLSRVIHVDPELEHHADQAFASSALQSLAFALPAGLVAALVMGAFAARRITEPVHRIAEAARDLSDARYDVRLPPTTLGPDFDAVTGAFNDMAARLEATEATRRRLLADLAHELRTPLATVDAFVEGLVDGVIEPTEETLATLKAQTARMHRLAEDVSAVSRAEEHRLELRPVALDLHSFLADVVTAASSRFADRQVRLELSIADGTPPVFADPERIGQVLGNLLDNALRHTPAGGAVTVSADQEDDAAVAVKVADTGPGIPPEHLDQVFERFHRVDAARDRAHGGSGIGLAIARAIVHDHGGRIGAANRPDGAGAVLTFTLPRAD